MPPATPPYDAAARRTELLDAADRVIREHGPDASMSSIAQAAGITKPILYRHFGDKGGLYRALALRYASPVLTELASVLSTLTDRQERMRTTMDTYLRFIESDPQIYRFLMHRALREQPDLVTNIAAFTTVVASGIAEILVRELGLSEAQRPSASAWAHGMVGLVQLAGDWWLESRQMPRAQLVEHLSALLWDGMGSLTSESTVVRNLVE